MVFWSPQSSEDFHFLIFCPECSMEMAEGVETGMKKAE